MMEEEKEQLTENKKEEKTKSKSKLFSWIEDNYDKLFIAVLVIAFIIRILIFLKTANQPLWWDEADYLSTGKKWGLGLNIRDIWYYRRGFLWPLFSAFFFWIGFGEIGIKLSEVLFSTGIVAVSYFLIKKMFDKKIALLTSIGLAFSWILLFFTGRILTDIPSAFFILLSLLFFWKGYVLKEGNKFLYLFALFFSLAVLTRMQSFMLAPPFFIYIFIKEKFKMFKNKQLWITLGIFILLLAPQFYIYSIHYGNPLSDISSHYFGLGAEAQEGGIGRSLSFAVFNYFKDLPYMLSIPVLIFFIIGLFFFFGDLFIGFDKIFKNESLQKKFFVLFWILSLFLIMGYVGQLSYVEQRYITAALPFLFMITSFSLLFLGNLVINHLKIKKKIIFFCIFVIFILIFIPNITLGNRLTESKLSSYSEIREAGFWIKDNSAPNDVIISQSYPQITYYAERSTYSPNYKNRDIEGFEELVEEQKPRYYMLSAIERSEDWTYSYPQSNTSRYSLTPVWIYPYQSQQPIVVIYEFNY